MPEDESIVAPTRTGYDFTGYRTQKDITPQVFYYNAEMKSVCNYDKTSDYTIFANWEAHTTTVVFDPQGGNNYGATRVTATFSAAMPTEGVQAPQRQGYTFGGYYSKANGQGTQYYTADMTSARNWDIDERLLDPQVTEVTLYAKWIPLTYTVTLDPQGGTGGTTSVTAVYGQPLPSGLTAPTTPGYEFRGYYGIANSEWEESQGNDNFELWKMIHDSLHIIAISVKLNEFQPLLNEDKRTDYIDISDIFNKINKHYNNLLLLEKKKKNSYYKNNSSIIK
jgi:hypothetical protein